jgi:allophanate hydrolase subunit 1
MTTNKTIAAQFTKIPILNVPAGLTGLTADGFRLWLSGESPAGYQFLGSTNLADWTPLAVLTNHFGTLQFTDDTATNLPFRSYRAVQQ